MLPRLLSTRDLDALQAGLALRYGWSVGRNPNSSVHAEDVVTDIQRRIATRTEPDPCWHAAYFGGILIQKRLYNSGNQALAFVVMFILLGRDGLELAAPPEEALVVLRGVQGGSLTVPKLASWLRLRTRPLRVLGPS
jgi:prophage maintenance system killer protein